MFNRSTKHHKPVMDHSDRTNKPKQEQIRSSLSKELETVVKAAIASPHSRRENVPSEITQNLCNTIEAIFIHGLKDPFFLKGTRYAKYPEPNFWPFVSKYSHRSVTNQIACLGQIKTEIGRSRAWIRIVLNENQLSHYLDLLASEKGSIQQFYGEEAFLRYLGDNEYSERIRGILKPLTALPIYAATNSSFLNTWTPTPLIFAGLMDGKPLKVGALTSRPNPKPGIETEEIAICAIDALVPEEDHDIGSPNYKPPRRKPSLKPHQHSHEDDDNSSVYSHPSMLDAGEMTYQHAVTVRRNASSATSLHRSASANRFPFPQSPLFSSTPVEKTILDSIQDAKPTENTGPVQVAPYGNTENNDPQSYAPIIVSRRIRRPSKRSGNDSRSSSESVTRESKMKTEYEECTRESRANSDMPSTIFGTVPNDFPFSLEDNSAGKPDTVDSGIADCTIRKEEEVENESVSLLDAITRLDTEDTESQRKSSLADEFFTENDNGCDGCEMKIDAERDRRETICEDDIFNVSMDTEDIAPRDIPVLQRNKDIEQFTEERSIPIGVLEKTDSFLGTSLHDELLGVLPSTSDTFENGIPMYVQSPITMGNSLAAIGARNHMWETSSDMSRLSSSSESCGPVVSFGQALRSAIENGGHNHDGYSESVCTSTHNENDESVVSSSYCSRKSSKSSATTETTDKLCVIAKERGLDAQDFRCAMCRKSIGGATFGKYETCSIDAKYYCVECMKTGGKVPIPARVLMDWDWRERNVSDKGRSWYESNQEKAFINIEERNPRLYTHVQGLRETKALREKLQLVSMYLFTCRESVAEDFRRRVWPKEYLHSEVHRYSFADLIDVKSGALQKKLAQLLKHATSHVMCCTLCRQKGFICELCSINEVIYPFQTEETHRCRVCFSVFHQQCWQSSGDCPKCERRRQFEVRRSLIDEPHSVLVLQP